MYVRTFRQRYFCVACLSCTAVFCYLLYTGQLDETPGTTIAHGTDDDVSELFDSPESDVQLFATIPLFRKEENLTATDDILYIDIGEARWQFRLPKALIIGVRQGGTRALLDILTRHPNVKACSREVHFFDRQENYKLGLDWYSSQMPLSLEADIVIERTPDYFIADDAPRLIYKMSPSVKLLVVVRDPTVRAISDYAELFEKYDGEMKPFEEYVTADSQHSIVKTYSEIVNTGVYTSHLKNWMKYFPLEQIHFVNGELLFRDPVQEMKKVQIFLALKPFIDEKLFYFDNTKGFPCLPPASNKNGETSLSGCLSDTTGRPHPEVNEDVVTLLRDYYRPFNEEFYSIARRNFAWP